jgi:PKD repeat protein
MQAKLFRATFDSESPSCADIASSWVEYPTIPFAKIYDIEVSSSDGSLWIAGETTGGEARVYSASSTDPSGLEWLDTGVIQDSEAAVPNAAASVMYNPVDGAMYAGTGSAEAQLFKGSLSPLASHAWSEPGIYDATLTATEGDGDSDVDIFQVTVAGRLAQPGIVVKRGKLITFVGSYSTIESGSISAYTWDFDDGTTGAGAVVEHKYDDKGKYLVKLTVTDALGHSADSYFVILVGVPPVAKMTADPREPEEDDVVTFDASESYDSDGAVESYAWDFPNKNSCAGAGVLSDTYPVEQVACLESEESKACYKFHEPCTYDVVLTVVDDDGLPDELGVKQVVHTRGVENKVWDLHVDATASYDTNIDKITRVPITVKNNGFIESPDFRVCVQSSTPTGVLSSECSEQSSSLAAGQSTVVELPSWTSSCDSQSECTVTLNVAIDYNEDFVFITPGAVRIEGLSGNSDNGQTVTVNVGKKQEISTEVLTPEFPEVTLLFALIIVPFMALRMMKRN